MANGIGGLGVGEATQSGQGLPGITGSKLTLGAQVVKSTLDRLNTEPNGLMGGKVNPDYQSQNTVLESGKALGKGNVVNGQV